jgi:hypothetical protein
MKIKYTGLANTREILKDQWATVDITHDDVVWNKENDYTADVKPEAGKWLLQNDAAFEEAKAGSESE